MSLLKRIGCLMILALGLPGAALAAFHPDASTVLITGANHGLGLELARQYAAMGWNVIATTRHPAGDPSSKQLEAIHAAHPNLTIEQLDVTDTPMIKALAARYKDQPIDV